MSDKNKNLISIIVMSIFLFGTGFICWFHGEQEYSLAERRYLKTMPAITWENVVSGRFMSDFESYTQDQFPARDTFRSIKSGVALFAFGKKDNNDLYLADGYINKLEYPYRQESAEHAIKVFSSVYDKYLEDTDCKVYYALIPDKGYYMAEANGYPAMDYAAMEQDFINGMENMTYIDLFDVMSLEDFYKTDTHWRQEKITDVAAVIASAMGKELKAEYELCKIEVPFYGVYHGQLSLPVAGEELFYLNNEELDGCYVYDYTNMREIEIYDLENAQGADPYEIYLSGPLSLITIENPNADTDAELVVFRDSFGSSIAPLWVESYSKITLIDIRYLYSGMVGNYVAFENQDVLFLYSTMVLNNSETIK